MTDVAEKLNRPMPLEEAAAVKADRAMLWKRILVWSSILTMLAGSALVIRMLG